MPLNISREIEAETTYEYGCDLRRLYPWKEVSDPIYWGAALGSVRVGEATTPHSHDEEETFLILSGHGAISMDGDRTSVLPGDIVYLPRGSRHTLENCSPTDPLRFLTIYWGSPEAIDALRQIDRPTTSHSINPTSTDDDAYNMPST